MANVCLFRWLVVVTASVFLAEMVGSNSVQQTEIEKQAFLKSLVDAKRQPVRSPKQTKFDGSVFGGIHDNAELPQSLENVRDNLYNLDFTLENVDLTKLSTNNGGTVVFACQQFTLEELGDVHFLGYDPIISPEDGLDIIHHIDVFQCTDAIGDRYKTVGDCMFISDIMSPNQGPCKELLTAYDKGAFPFALPDGYGISIGPTRTQFTRFVVQIHFLLPQGFKQQSKSLTPSGLRLWVTPELREIEAGVMGWIDYSLNVPSGQKSYETKSECPPTELVLLLENDFKMNRSITPIAIHLHGHNAAKKIVVEHHSRDGKFLENYYSMDPYHGYGDDETIKIIPQPGALPPTPFRPGDRLTGRCWFDSTWSDKSITYGVDHGDEMCGFLLYFYPHDPSKTSHRWQLCQTMTNPDGKNQAMLPS
eukprot:m.126102 g.126102  ORF g.126102 m.126102 type:complete len:420 (+) comp29177_c0_seq1:199-1458(+)